MAQKGRKPKLTALKVLEGNPGYGGQDLSSTNAITAFVLN